MPVQKSTVITNWEASPQVFSPSGNSGGKTRVLYDSFEVTALAAADVVVLDKLITNAIIQKIELINDDLGTTLTVDVGIYSDAGVTVKDVDIFAAGVDLGTATTSLTDVGWVDIVNSGNYLYEQAGDLTDPKTKYFICLTVATSGTPAAGTLGYRITYAI